MFYIKHTPEQEFLEIIQFEKEFGTTLPYFADLTSEMGPDTTLQRIETVEVSHDEGDRAYLLWEPNAAMWCYLNADELRVYEELKEPTTFPAITAKFRDVKPRHLARFLTHLYRRGLLSLDSEPGIAPDIYEDGPLANKGFLVELYMTEKCNLGCTYCFSEAAPQNSTMPLETGYLTLDKAFALPARRFIIEFAGGETYVEFATFRKLVEYIELKRKQTGKDPYIAVQSNGTHFHKPEIRKFLIKHRINPAVSIDGSPEDHDAVRPLAGGKGSSAAVLRGIEALQKHGFAVPSLTTVSRANIDHPEELVDFFVSKDLHHGMFKEILWLGRAEDSWDSTAVAPEEFFQFLRRFLEHTTANKIDFRDLTTKRLMTNLISRTRDTRCMRSQCGAGFDYFVIRPNGDVYPCADHVRPELKMGNIRDPEPLELYCKKQPTIAEMECHRKVSNIPGCRECDWRHVCEAECGLGTLKTYGTLYHQTPKCEFYKSVYPYLLKFAYRHPEVLVEYVEDSEIVSFGLTEEETASDARGNREGTSWIRKLGIPTRLPWGRPADERRLRNLEIGRLGR